MRLNSPSPTQSMNSGQRFTWQTILTFMAEGNFADAFDRVVHLNNDLLESDAEHPEGYDEVLAALAIWKTIHERYPASAA